jgi:N-acetylglucosamine-6-phosphate deacetylase
MSILLAGGDLALPDRLVRGDLLIDGDRIAAVCPPPEAAPPHAARVDLHGALVVPGFIDVHVHGIEGHDVLDDERSVRAVAERLPRYGVTAFCPTSIACDPVTLSRLLDAVSHARGAANAHLAHVLPAHLESNFINPAFAGAQPVQCLRSPAAALSAGEVGNDGFAAAILEAIEHQREAVGIVTVAPELAGGLALVRRLASSGHRVSIGHSGASYEEAREAIDAGVSHATHLFNRMTPLAQRAPGAAAAVLESERVRTELICDGFHVHPAMLRLAIRAKGAAGVMAITDGTAGSGLVPGSRTRLGGRPIVVTHSAATLDDGTLAGSILTMDGAFRTLVNGLRVPIVDAARMCSTTPADQLGAVDRGRIEVGAIADLAVLDSELRVCETYLRGEPWRNRNRPPGRNV